ncbi:MAG: hypothetical protein WB555_19325 [Candidatus Korobacteraceae bacterium]
MANPVDGTESGMNTKMVLTASAAIEGATGVALILIPEIVSRALLGVELNSAGVALARVAGLGFLSLAIACWARGNGASSQAIRALFVYNLLVGLYLGYLRVGGGFTGYLLWPACILHVVLAVLLARPAVA